MKTAAILLAVLCVAVGVSGSLISSAQSGELANSFQASPDDKFKKAAETRSGIFTTIWGDSIGAEEIAPVVPRFFLSDESGTVELIIEPHVLRIAGGINALNKKRVSITGRDESGSNDFQQVFRAERISAEKVQTPDVTGQNANSEMVSRKFVNILCRFGDSTGTTPRDPSYYVGLTGNIRPGQDHYYREISYNNIDLVGTETHGWYNLPQPLSYYYVAGGQPNFQRLTDDCAAAADAVVDFSTVHGINFFYNQNFGCCAWGGSIGATLDGVTRAFPATWMPPGGTFQSILAHEIGHSFGWAHSANALGTTYQSGWDVMSQDRYNSAASTDPVYGVVGQNTIAYNLDKVGWILPSRKYTAGVGTVTINLERLSQPGATGYLMAQIPIDGTADFYTVEARYRTGYDTKLPNDAVVIHRVIPSRMDDAWTVDEDGNANPMDAGGQWLPGETLNDTTTGIRIQVVSATATGFAVRITKSSTTAANVSIGGRIYNAIGRPVFGAQITITDQNGNIRSARSNMFGFYRFNEVQAGATYIVSVNHKRYTFTPQAVSVNEELTDLDFTALP